jgi:hypothetical protein
MMTAHEFHHGTKQDILHYTDFKDDDHFSTWHQKFVATANMHHMHFFLDPTYVPKDHAEKVAFEELQIFMCSVRQRKAIS